MYNVMIVKGHKALIHKRTSSIIKAQELVCELREQGHRVYYIERKDKTRWKE